MAHKGDASTRTDRMILSGLRRLSKQYKKHLPITILQVVWEPTLFIKTQIKQTYEAMKLNSRKHTHGNALKRDKREANTLK